MAYSGTKSLLYGLDDGWNGGTGNTNFVYGTYNLNGINAALQEIYGWIFSLNHMAIVLQMQIIKFG